MKITCSICSSETEVLPHKHWLHYIHLFQLDPLSTHELTLGIQEWERDLSFITRIAGSVYDFSRIFFIFDDAILCVNCGMEQYKELKEMLKEAGNLLGSIELQIEGHGT